MSTPSSVTFPELRTVTVYSMTSPTAPPAPFAMTADFVVTTAGAGASSGVTTSSEDAEIDPPPGTVAFAVAVFETLPASTSLWLMT